MHISIRSRLVTALLALTSFAQAQQLNITSSTTCTDQCKTLAESASAWEISQHAAPDLDDFYTTPANFSSNLKEGTLLHVEYATNLSTYTVPSGLSMSRIIYTTSDINGTILPTSAYILWPYAPYTPAPGLKQGQFPLVAWAHGTSGYTRGCAPSNYRSLQYHFMVPYQLALQGLAVVAPDYAGLGINSLPNGKTFKHNWVNFPAQAADLANAIVGARRAFPDQLSADGSFVAMGHSQGGGTTWGFAERQASKPLAGYKGTVSIAPPTRIFDLLAQLSTEDPAKIKAPVLLGQQPTLINAVTALYPSYNYSGMTPLSRDRWLNVYDQLEGCLPVQSLAFADVAIQDSAKPGWWKDNTVQMYANRTAAGRKKFKGPLLVIGGEGDMIVDVDQLSTAVSDTCAMNKGQKWGQSLEFVKYQGMNHFPVIQASSLRWMSWIKNRLSGKMVENHDCQMQEEAGFRTNFTYQTLGPNFLVELPSAMDAWELSL